MSTNEVTKDTVCLRKRVKFCLLENSANRFAELEEFLKQVGGRRKKAGWGWEKMYCFLYFILLGERAE